jgi:putative membrane protein
MPFPALRHLALVASAAICLIGFASFAQADDPSPGRSVSAWDGQWLMMSIEGDRFEVAGGKLAQSKATTPEVRALGARLVKDHSKSLKDAIKLAKKLRVDVPTAPSPSQRWELKTVAVFSGKEFDRRYADLEVLDHKQDITEAKAEVKQGTNREVRGNARTELPTLKTHLKLSRAALAAAGG